ncbi:hypothetical protein [Microvirga tunisiensis]|uniref:hypothetical protein n=1 Tax=Microvirga tunisiensis TaxID=2108360 RepID=UPI00128D7E96|nr:hypothetical protein [Microvirga tunisiensis]MPR12365.1 hypothetical protein [Microvirga tunisiensis]
MNREQQAARIEKIVTTIAERAVSVPPDHRSAYIQDEVEKVRQAFLQTYEADEGLRACAMAFVDKMSGWIEARVHTLETEAVGKTEADEGRTEPHS